MSGIGMQPNEYKVKKRKVLQVRLKPDLMNAFPCLNGGPQQGMVGWLQISTGESFPATEFQGLAGLAHLWS